MEILIAVFIFSVVISTIYVSMTGTLRIVNETERDAEIYGMARIALERLSEDLASAYLPPPDKSAGSDDDDPGDSPFKFAGEKNEIDGERGDTLSFSSLAHVAFGEDRRFSGVTEIAYSVEQGEEDEGLVLLRSDDVQMGFRVPGEERGDGLVVCEQLQSVRFTYYDSEGEEYDNWDSAGDEFETPMPRMVAVTLAFVNKSNEEAPLKFMTTVALPGGGIVAEEDG
jgi:general secretion pathway protein J